MSAALIRVGTVYIPVQNIEASSSWYIGNLGVQISYKDKEKAMLNFAGTSFFLVKAKENEHNYFYDIHLNQRFPITFEVNGVDRLKELHERFERKGIKVGGNEDRGHTGRNFVFHDLDGNMFDVWSELSSAYKALIDSTVK
ncbi:VOC family protein [Planomicrobium sp. Y74]|uniref:VOC family protein n=1 Tax=Planomicrobium sp. Y74 TaxID=2478977 RepID=UPI000EF49600|nr:VOC family protein [Planomicrobium sp. Y74]RLQ89696.1 VOC family protein [Planomicrobium sp. Y74]